LKEAEEAVEDVGEDMSRPVVGGEFLKIDGLRSLALSASLGSAGCTVAV
jgi:hypothetical protein